MLLVGPFSFLPCRKCLEVPPERNRRRSSRSEMGVAFEWDEPQEDERNGARTVQLENGEIDETQDNLRACVCARVCAGVLFWF